MKRKKIYLYAGYYEMFITDTPLGKPYSLISWHYSVENAEKNAKRLHPDDNYYFKTNLFPEDLEFVLDSYIQSNEEIPLSEIQGQEFYIV